MTNNQVEETSELWWVRGLHPRFFVGVRFRAPQFTYITTHHFPIFNYRLQSRACERMEGERDQGKGQWSTALHVGFLSRLTRMSLRRLRRREQDVLPTQHDHRSRFYEDYRKESEEYDEEFLTKYDEDLNTTLIFVSFL